jgi:hypothetical protein
MMTPVGRLVLFRSVTKAEVIGALSWLTVPALIGPVCGPLISRFFTTYFTCCWIFWINVPICLLGIVLATLYIPNIKAEKKTRFDDMGYAFLAFGLASLVAGTTSIGSDVMPRWIGNTGILIGAALLGVYVWHARRAAKPILDLRMFQVPSFRISVIGGSLFRVGVGASPFLLPLLLQVGFGFSPMQSGAITFATAGGAMAAKFFTVHAMRLAGFRTLLLVNGAISAALLAAPAAFGPATPWLAITGVLFITGVLRSLQFTAVNALAFADIDSPRMSQATSISSVVQQISLSIGVTIGALALELALGGRHGLELTVADFVPAFVIVAAMSALCLFPFVRLAADAGAEVSGKRRK